MVRAWRYLIRGVTGATVPVFLLDTDIPGNEPLDRSLTDRLYGGDARYRLCQELILGAGGRADAAGARLHARREIPHERRPRGAARPRAPGRGRGPHRRASPRGDRPVKQRCVFTTHTPVPAGHDQFDLALARAVLGPSRVEVLQTLKCCDSALNLTLVALELSHYVNGVTRRHGEVSRSMFPGYPIGSITNGVHSTTWTAPPFAALYDRYIPDWRRDSFSLRYALGIPVTAIQSGPPGGQGAAGPDRERADARALRPRALHDGLRPPDHRLQAAHAPAARPCPPSPARRRPRPAAGGLRRQGASA